MSNITFYKTDSSNKDNYSAVLYNLLENLDSPFLRGDTIAIKLHWGERGNKSFLPPDYARVVVNWLMEKGIKPLIFDTTVLYSGGRHTGKDSIETACSHGFTEEYLGCPVVIGDGMDYRGITEINAGFKHFETVQVTDLINKVDGFFIFSHFKGHLFSGFGGAIKNISMGFASRAQKQRMHADAYPQLIQSACTKCGICTDVCPAGAASIHGDDFPLFDLQKCIGCAQCIALCPSLALKILWNTGETFFQEKLVETAAAVWNLIQHKTLLVNAVLNITRDCDCIPGDNPIIANDFGFVGGHHPLTLDRESINFIGNETIDQTHPSVPWRRQFEYAKEIGFFENK